MSLRRQIWVVLLSYLTRTGFRWAIVSGLSGFALMLIGVGCGKFIKHNYLDENPFSFLIIIGSMAVGFSLFAALMIFFAHARQQLMGPTTRFMPNTRRANLIVAAGFFFAIIFGISWTIHDLDYFPGMVLIVSLFMILIACAVCNPWLAPLPIEAILLLATNMQVLHAATEITQEWSTSMFHDETPLRMAMLSEHEHYVWALRAILLLLDILALMLLERVSRPRRAGVSLPRNVLTMLTLFKRGSRQTKVRPHEFLHTPFARIMHRRIATHNWRATAFLAAVIAVLTMMFCHVPGPWPSPVIGIVATLAVLPGLLAAIGWRDRWGSYEFETLYPARQQQFVRDLLAGLLLNLIEYWFAGLAALLLAIVAMRPGVLHESQLWTAISGSAMMQALWIGSITLAGQRRQTLPFFAVLGASALAMLVAFDNLIRADSPLYPSHFVAIATIEMLAGFLFLAIATLAWRRRAAA